eukprot:scaffold624_cov402-Prasinococcus_capsulatus_cf.AAC.33
MSQVVTALAYSQWRQTCCCTPAFRFDGPSARAGKGNGKLGAKVNAVALPQAQNPFFPRQLSGRFTTVRSTGETPHHSIYEANMPIPVRCPSVCCLSCD